MASAAEQLARSINFGAFNKATELKKRIWFTLGALVIYRLGTFIPLPGIDTNALEVLFSQQANGIIGMFDMFSGGALAAHDHSRAEHHAVHLGLDHHAADVEHPALAGSHQERGRGGPQEDQPVYPQPDRCSGRSASLRHRQWPCRHAYIGRSGGAQCRPDLLHHHRDLAHLRHRVPDVAGRADHPARRGQRHLADHLQRDRGAPARRPGHDPGTGPHRRPGSLGHPGPAAGRGCRDRLHRLLRARPAADHRPVSQAPGRQQDVRRRSFASAAQAQ